jgi:hypothetical protein
MPIRGGDETNMVPRFPKPPVNIAHIPKINELAKQARSGVTAE